VQFGKHDACLEEFKTLKKMKAGIDATSACSLVVGQRRMRRENYYHSKTMGRVKWLFGVGRSIQVLNFFHGARIIMRALLVRPCWQPYP
jgi:hypothetical protein